MSEKAGITVLIMDDSPKDEAALTGLLQKIGYCVDTVGRGAKAVESAKTSHPDIILLDITGPKKNGFETCAKLKEDDSTREIPIILIVDQNDIDAKAKTSRIGGADFISRPFENDEINARIETQLILHRQRSELALAKRELSASETELKVVKGRLSELEMKLNAFIRALPGVSFTLDEEGRCLEIIVEDPGFLPARPNELIGRFIQDVLPPKEGQKILNAISQTIQTGKTQMVEYESPILDGSGGWFEGRTALVEKNDQGKSKVVLLATSITERIQNNREVQQQIGLDTLTGCYNQRLLLERAEQEVQRTIRYKHPLSLLIINVDQFKRFNYQYGRQIGNQMLCNLVDLCQNQLRNVDFIGRSGGDEFIVLMPETGKLGAMLASERLRKNISQMRIKTDVGELSVTVSMGLASLDKGFEKTQHLELLIKRADGALKDAKSAGRNCIRAA